MSGSCSVAMVEVAMVEQPRQQSQHFFAEVCYCTSIVACGYTVYGGGQSSGQTAVSSHNCFLYWF